MGGDFEDRLVPHDPPARQISLLGRGFAPRREFAQNRKESRVDPAAQAKSPPCIVRVVPVCRWIRQPGHLLGKPGGPAVRRQPLLQTLVDRAQMDDVGEGVVNLPLGKRPV